MLQFNTRGYGGSCRCNWYSLRWNLACNASGVDIGGPGFAIEKCKNQDIEMFMRRVLDGLSFKLYHGTEDPIADEDESDVYRKVCNNVVCLMPVVHGGDYNDGPVKCHQKTIDSTLEAICRIAEHFPTFLKMRALSAQAIDPSGLFNVVVCLTCRISV